MRQTLSAMLLAGSMFATPAVAAPMKPNAVDTFVGNVAATPADAAAINAMCDRFVNEIARRQTALEGEKGRATIPTTLQAYDDLTDLLFSSLGEMTLYREVMADAPRRDAAAACEVKINAANTKISLSRPIYERLKAVDVSKADSATKLLHSRIIGSFERSGIGLPDAERAKAQELSDKISQAGTAFDQAIAAGRKTVTADPAELEGLPADYIAAHKPDASGNVTLSTDYPDLFPVMSYAKSSALRQRIYEAFLTRAWPENDANLRTMIDLRDQLAKLVGRKDFASLVLEDKMVNTPEKVVALLDDMASAARPAADRDYARKLAVYRLDHPGATSFNVWDNSYLTNLVQKQDFSYDRQEARKYFAYNNVRDGILRLTQDLFGVKITPWQTAKWDPMVETYEISEASGPEAGKLLGRFYFDSHPRPGKYDHANMIPLRVGVAGRTIPVGALVMNLPAGDHSTGLMEHGDVQTFLHEFGHMLHHIFGGQTVKWAGVSSISTEWDFAEAPSQMLEEWVYDYDTLSRFAVDAQGKTIPRDLVEKMNKARYFNLGMADLRQLGYSNISLRLHQGPAPADLGARTRELAAVYDLLPLPPSTQSQASFGHLNGYSAIYYTYEWSKVIADDMFTQFAKNGMRDTATALRYRTLVLGPGGSKPAAELVADFLGRPISIDAYKAEVAKDK
ncbi:M3 family metallopeptidase [Novosphingobium olei]|uniref:Zn-dependent oligopeptidase n=1 Tax=Novosphingobium olei TaxID=2728851 RepID=A0A7Y0BNJ7_9SPHN|nr:M3 family metallopeptidase [Novosphingobium olei]NML93490.1 Zn-dependent oligopeptidase [Novosphingobium olei]